MTRPPASECTAPTRRSAIFPTACPAWASRLPILFSEGVSKGRIDPCAFVRLTATNPARLFGLYPRKCVEQHQLNEG